MPDAIDPEMLAALAAETAEAVANVRTTPATPVVSHRERRASKRARRAAPAYVTSQPQGAPPQTTVDPPANVAIGNPVEARDVASVWTYVLEKSREDGHSADHVAVGVKRVGVGPNPNSGVMDCGIIDGASIEGDASTSAGEAIVNYITDVFHLAWNLPGPARYKCVFHYKTGGAANAISAPIAEITLAAPEQIRQQRAAAERVRARQGMQAGPGSFDYAQGYGMPPRQGMGYPPPQSSSSDTEAMRRELARLTGMYEERLRQEGLQPAYVAPSSPVVAPVLTKEEEDARLAAVIAKTLVGMGFTPAAAQVAQVQPATAPQVQAALVDPMDQMDKMLNYFERMEKFKTRAGEMFAPEVEEPPPVVSTPNVIVENDPNKFEAVPIVKYKGEQILTRSKLEKEGLFEYMIQLGIHNPTAAKDLLSSAAQQMDQGTFGRLVRKFLDMGGAQAAAAVAHGGSPNPPGEVPAPNGATRPWSGPTA